MPELPPQFLNTLEHLPEFDRAAFVAAHGDSRRETSIRLNPFKRRPPAFDGMTGVPWCRDGYYLQGRPLFTLDPLLHAGAYYVQEPGSMFLDHALRDHIQNLSAPRVLDLCAAPGGKSTLLNSLMGENGVLVANELVRKRVPALAENLSRWGTLNTVVTNNAAHELGALAGIFDVVVVDAPCSGSGLFRKQPEAIAEWSPRLVEMCAQRQHEILSDVLPALKPGGLLLYSTCSYAEAENEAVCDWLISTQGMEPVAMAVPGDWGLVSAGPGYRFYPDKTRSEGFFCALLRLTKPLPARATAGGRKTELLPKAMQAAFSELLQVEKGELRSVNGRSHFMTAGITGFVDRFGGGLYLRKAGQYVGEIKGRDVVPSQELAWSLHVADAVPKLELDLEDALKYLKKQPLQVATKTGGLVRAGYAGLGLGWGKALPGRLNNYLPNELRIRL